MKYILCFIMCVMLLAACGKQALPPTGTVPTPTPTENSPADDGGKPSENESEPSTSGSDAQEIMADLLEKEYEDGRKAVEMYSRLSLGMSKSEARSVMGGNGSTSGDYVYWEGGQTVNALFNSDKIISKAISVDRYTCFMQFSGEVTEEMQLSISAGMTYDEVAAALSSPGVEISLGDAVKIGRNLKEYRWYTMAGDYIKVLFREDMTVFMSNYVRG